MIDNTDLEKILEKLEYIEEQNEALAVKLLKEFNDASKEYTHMLRNTDESLSHDEWKVACDKARKKLEKVMAAIYDF